MTVLKPTGLAVCVLLASVACRPDSAPEASTTDTSVALRLASFGRADPGERSMIALLDRIAREAPLDNPFLGRSLTERLRSDLRQPGLSLPRRWLIHAELGREELRLGRQQEALEHYLEAHRLLGESEGPVPQDYVIRTAYELGVAYMRYAETQNCVARHTNRSCIFPLRDGGVHRKKDCAAKAARYLSEALANAPATSWTHLKARWLLNIAHMALGDYPDAVPERFRIPPDTFASEQLFPPFEEIAPRLGLASFDLAGGAAVDDFDGDGLLDVVVSTSDTSGQLRYFRNDGDGSFTERTHQAGLTGLFGGLNLTHADYDNDGHLDLLVLRGGWWRKWGRHPNSLVHNNGDGTFTDVTFEAGLGEEHFPTQTASWADYDNDGDLDLYVGNETDPQAGNVAAYGTGKHRREYNVWAPSQLFENNGDGTFTDVTARAGVQNFRYTKGVAWGDYDGDRFPDLFVSNMGHENRLYRNNHDGTFTDVAHDLGLTRPYASFAAWFWDVNNDGALDLFVSAYGGPRLPADVGSVAASYLGLRNPGEEKARLYLGDGRGGFEDAAVEWNLLRTTLPMGANFGDLDNDGHLDFYLGTGYPFYEALMPNVMYRNRGGRGFADVTTAGGFGHLQKGHAVVFADLDNDGDQDVYEQMGGAYPGDAYGNALFQNPGWDHHWIKIRLVGVTSNRSAIGARLRLDLIEDGRPRSIYRTVNTGGSFGSNPLRREIGLGAARRIERLVVYWPASDTTQRFDAIRADQMIEIVEGDDEVRSVPLDRVRF